MSKNIISNYYVERLEFLPDEVYVEVSKSWLSSIVPYLVINDQYYDLLNMIRTLLEEQNYSNMSSFTVPRVIKISVGNVKKLVNICECGTFCCTFPYNFNELANDFLRDKLGIIKSQIEFFIDDDEVDGVFELIDKIEDDYIKKLSLIYMKFVYSEKTKKIIEDINISRRKTINKIDCKLCN